MEWANTCRRRRFDMAGITIRSPSDLQALESFTTNGRQRLEPIHSLIYYVTVWQNWDSRPWCHTVRTSEFYKMAAPAGIVLHFNVLILSGPVPAHLPLAAYHLPIWSLPRALPSYFFPFTTVKLQDIHFLRFPTC